MWKDQIVCVGGFGFLHKKSGTSKSCLKTVEMYVPEADQWVSLPNLPREVPWLKVVVSNGRLFVVGKKYTKSGKISDKNRIYEFVSNDDFPTVGWFLEMSEIVWIGKIAFLKSWALPLKISQEGKYLKTW